MICHLEDECDLNVKRFHGLLDIYNLLQHDNGPANRADHTLDVVNTRDIIQHNGYFICQAPSTEHSSIKHSQGHLSCDHFLICFLFNVFKPDYLWRDITYRKRRSIDILDPTADMRNCCGLWDLNMPLRKWEHTSNNSLNCMHLLSPSK